MINKYKHLLSILLLIILLVGCNEQVKDEDKIIITKAFNTSSYVDVTINEIEDLIDARNDFILYIGNEGCISCSNFKPVIEKYINDKDILVHHIDLSSTSRDALSMLGIQFTNIYPPLLVLMQKGVKKHIIEIEAKLLEDTSEEKQNQLYKFIDNTLLKYGIAAAYTDIKLDDLNSKIESSESFKIIITSTLSIEYKRVFTNGLRDFLTKNETNIYRLDTHYLSEVEFSSIKDEFEINGQFDILRFDNGEVNNKVSLENENYQQLVAFLNEQ